MAQAAALAGDPAGGAPQPGPRLRRDWRRRLLRELAVFLLGLLILAAGALVLLDTSPGRRFIAEQIAGLETSSGLRIRIGRIEGSIWGKSRLRSVTIYDGRGPFLSAPLVELDWAPGAWLYNALHVDRLAAPRVTLSRLPELRRSGRKGPLLPGFDIYVGALDVRRLDLLQPVTGRARSGSLRGRANIRSGLALVELRAALDGNGDRLHLLLDAEPDRDRFDLSADFAAPADGLLPALAGVKRPVRLQVSGEGSWSRWTGNAAMDLSGRPAARLRLLAADGRYALNGGIAAAPFLSGRLARLTAPLVRVNGGATFAERRLDGRLVLGSGALRAAAAGGLDLGEGAYRRVSLGVDLLRPAALFPDMRGRNVRLLWTLDGPFERARFAYRLTAPQVSFGTTGFRDVRAEGRGQLSPWPLRVPLRLSARAITGVGDAAGAILARAVLQGVLTVTPGQVRGERLELRSDRLRGTVGLLLDLVTGDFELLLSGGLTRYRIPGLGIVDVRTDLRVVPGPGGRGTRVVGTGRAWVRRLDNALFADLAGGLPRIETALERGSDGTIRFSNLQLFAPKLRLAGEGRRNRDGTFVITAAGRQARYGPLRLALDGPIARPRLDLLLASPNAAMGLADVRLQLLPAPDGFSYRAAGGSRLGPFSGTGRILLPPGAPAVIDVAALQVGGTVAAGQLRPVPGGLAGALALSGGGVNGRLQFAAAAEGQRIAADLSFAGARFPGVLAVRSGRLQGSALIGPAGTTLSGSADGRGVQLAGVELARLVADGRLVDGAGQVRASLSGTRGAPFDLHLAANLSEGRAEVSGRGAIAGRPVALAAPAVLTRSGDGWALAPARLSFSTGQALVSGRTGSRPSVEAQLQRMPLQLLGIGWPGLGLAGEASGRLSYSWAGGRSGRADLRLRGVTRAGTVLASQPVDLGIAAAISGSQAAVRAVAASQGRTVGRMQARFAPLGSGPVLAELLGAPLFAQLRYSGPADTLWRLGGSRLFDLSGQVAVGADVSGRLLAPVIRGSLRSTDARLESAATGTVIDGLAADARFTGSRMVLTRLSGRSGPGTVVGSGTIDFAGGTPRLDLAFNASNALLLDRDDVAGRFTGPLRIRSGGGGGGTISGDLRLERGRFTLGRAAAASVPRLPVRRRSAGDGGDVQVADLQPWRLDLRVAGEALQATGLGIDSLWSTDLRVGGSAGAPRFTGVATLVRGEYEFAGRSFRLDRGVIRFRGESPPDPLLDIRAVADVQGLDASVRVSGTGQRPEITFASVPALPQDELLSRLLFGTSITNLSAPEALQLASAVAALQSGEGGLDPINSLRRAVGLDRLRILPADVSADRGPSVAAGKYFGRRLFVEVITDGQGYSATRAEYQVTRWLSLLSSISTIGRTSANVRVSRDY
jgi:translocation and assembly module TamB